MSLEELASKIGGQSGNIQKISVSAARFYVGKQKYFYVSKPHDKITRYESLLAYVMSDLAGDTFLLKRVHSQDDLVNLYPRIVAKMFGSILAFNQVIGPSSLTLIVERERPIMLGECVYFVAKDTLVFQDDTVRSYLKNSIRLTSTNYTSEFGGGAKHNAAALLPPRMRTIKNKEELTADEQEEILMMDGQEENILTPYVNSENLNGGTSWLTTRKDLLMKMYVIADKLATHFFNLYEQGKTDWILYRNLTVSKYTTAHTSFCMDYVRTPVVNNCNPNINRVKLREMYLGKSVRKQFMFNTLSSTVETPIFTLQQASMLNNNNNNNNMLDVLQQPLLIRNIFN
jgi:hypothetical protein